MYHILKWGFKSLLTINLFLPVGMQLLAVQTHDFPLQLGWQASQTQAFPIHLTQTNAILYVLCLLFYFNENLTRRAGLYWT